MSKFLARSLFLLACISVVVLFAFASSFSAASATFGENSVDSKLELALHQAGFTGNIESTLERRLGRPVDPTLANVGRVLWFDTITGLNNDNTCGGCHSPTNGFGDTQSIAIGIENNGIVGPDRAGPRNMRRTPMAINTAFYPNLMWNSRFVALSENPFDNRQGFLFPRPEGLSLSDEPQLLVAQAFIPPTERTEVAGFHFPGDNDAIRAEVLKRLNATPAYRKLFGQVFPQVKAGAPIDFGMFGKAIAEFEFTLTFADAPIDRYARGNRIAMTEQEKRGALLFFGAAHCSQCHSVSGESNEMFSDFQDHVIGVPQIVPQVTNNTFDGAKKNQDFGREEITGDVNDRYKFRSSPLRNVALQPTFMHNGAFTNLADALRFHLNAVLYDRTYSPGKEQLDSDLRGPIGPMRSVLAHLDPLLAKPRTLTNSQFDDLLAFVRDGLLDPLAKPQNLQRLVPEAVPSGRPVLRFEFP